MSPRSRLVTAAAGFCTQHGPAYGLQITPRVLGPLSAVGARELPSSCPDGAQLRRGLSTLATAAGWLVDAGSVARAWVAAGPADAAHRKVAHANLVGHGILRRHFTAQSSGEGPDASAPDAKLASDFLQTSAVITMREDLKRIAAGRNVIPLSEMLEICQKSGVATTEEDAREVYKALQKTGVVIGAGKWVYLRPKEVINTVQRYIPHTAEEITMRIQELERKLAPMAEEKKRIECKAEKRGRNFLYATLFAMTAQYSIIFRLTYWELSWDVMEPVAYFASGGTSMLCLIYYLVFRTSFDYDAVAHQWKRSYLCNKPFDHEYYASLTRELESYQRSLQGMRLSHERAKQE